MPRSRCHNHGHSQAKHSEQSSDSDDRLEDKVAPVKYSDAEIVKTVQGEESPYAIVKQSFGPLLLAGLGMVLAGLYLHHLHETIIFQQVKALTILVPALIGLKGNLEMTLASRLSSLYNLGLLEKSSDRFEAFRANFCLLMALSILAGFVAASLGQAAVVLFGLAAYNPQQLMLLIATCVSTTCLASLVLGTITMILILLSYRFKLNPDNIATPIAAALGDLLTVYILNKSARFFFDGDFENCNWLVTFFLLGTIAFATIMLRMAMANPRTRQAFKDSCSHLLAALIISSCSGVIFDHASHCYNHLDVYQPVFNGLGGNLASIQASRMTSYLHKIRGLVKDQCFAKIADNPFSFLIRDDVHSNNARLLMQMVIPLHLVMFTACNSHEMQTNCNLCFLVIYLLAALMQVLFLLFLAELIVTFGNAWSDADLDNVVIPYLTSCGDLLGALHLWFAFDLYYGKAFNFLHWLPVDLGLA